ncbi:MAG: hypothetical protein WDZ83_00235 [Rhizobiaceae bacterium]
MASGRTRIDGATIFKNDHIGDCIDSDMALRGLVDVRLLDMTLLPIACSRSNAPPLAGCGCQSCPAQSQPSDTTDGKSRPEAIKHVLEVRRQMAFRLQGKFIRQAVNHICNRSGDARQRIGISAQTNDGADRIFPA